MAAACTLIERQGLILHDENCVRDSPTPQELWANLRVHFHSTPQEFETLLGRFSELCPEVLNCLRHMESSAAAKAMEPVVQCLRLLQLCGYPYPDIEVIVSYGSIYLQDCLDQLQSEGETGMQAKELSLVICLFFFMAHSYTEDVCCPLHIWHQHVFAGHCQLSILNAALFRLMEQRDFILRVDCDAFEERLKFLRVYPDPSVLDAKDK